MSDDETIDKVLQLMQAAPNADIYSNYEDVTGLDTNEQEVANSVVQLVTLMIHYGLIEGESPYYNISAEGILINQNGGWLKKIGDNEKHSSKTRRTKQLELLLKVLAPILIIAIAILGQMQHTAKQNIQQLEEQSHILIRTIQSLEKSNQQFSRTTLEQKKEIDSLRNVLKVTPR